MISGPARLPKVHDSGSSASVAVQALIAARWSAVVCHWSGEGLRSAGHDPDARAPRSPSWMRVPLAPSGIGVQLVAVGVGVEAGVEVGTGGVVRVGGLVVAVGVGSGVCAVGAGTSPSGGGTAPSGSSAATTVPPA